MSDYNGNRTNSDITANLDDTVTSSADTTIIGLMKSSVARILPNKLSKWFSPSGNSDISLSGSGHTINNNNNNIDTSINNNVAINGNMRSVSNLRRRRIEIESEEDFNQDADDSFCEMNQLVSEESSTDEYEEDNEEDDDGDDDDAVLQSRLRSGPLEKRRCAAEYQPPSKRSRESHNVNGRSTTTPRNLLPSPIAVTARSEIAEVHYNSMISGGQQQELGTTDINHPAEIARTSSRLSARRSLKIPVSTPLSSLLPSLKRQSLNRNMETDIYRRNCQLGTIPTHTSTTIVKIDDCDDDYDNDDAGNDHRKQLRPCDKDEESLKGSGNLNGCISAPMPNKRQCLITSFNGTEPNVIVPEEDEEVIDTGSESSDGIARQQMPSGERLQRNSIGYEAGADGYYNQSPSNSRNCSRTSSIGNGLNFDSHLEGRKSLFSLANGPHAIGLNNSTLSLNSLNRRQFNASIYGSTSALSDSRLLSANSSFYKGRTTYGGAAAYNKYGSSRAGDGAAASGNMRVTPICMRPTSSLSTLSSSNNSIAAAGNNNPNTADMVDTTNNANTNENDNADNNDDSPNATKPISAISGTAKRILDLINDFTTPLSEAKKMANSTIGNQTQQHEQEQSFLSQTRTRQNESELNNSRGMRLLHIRAPYVRPNTIHLQIKSVNGKLSNSPPVQKLQVPTMAQLLQMKQLHNSTERSRQIAAEKSTGVHAFGVTIDNTDEPKQKHTNKMRSQKSSLAARVTNTKAMNVNNEQPLTVNLPNIAFPMMESVPKIDIALPSTATVKIPKITSEIGSKAKDVPAISVLSSPLNVSAKAMFAYNPPATSNTTMFNMSQNNLKNNVKDNAIECSSTSTLINFKFSVPLNLQGDASTPLVQCNYEFSAPRLLESIAPPQESSKISAVPLLKSGSVLDALKTPFSVPTSLQKKKQEHTKSLTTEIAHRDTVSGFGNQFKATDNEWKCDVCLVRNKNDAKRCIACDAPCNTTITTPTTTTPISATITMEPTLAKSAALSSFDDKFKMTSGEWECDACMVRNKAQTDKCVACETVHSKNTKLSKEVPPSFNRSQSSFSGFFKMPSGDWECETCMVRNKPETVKCVACETLRKNTTEATTTTTMVAPKTSSSFGDVFKSKANTWECPTCLIQNAQDALACVACETSKPGHNGADNKTTAAFTSTVASTAIFSLAAGSAPKLADAGFKELVGQQKAGRWECEACMTLNDVARLKCVCCEQAKPGTQKSPKKELITPEFSFGSATTKFNFGFAAAKSSIEQPTSASTAVKIADGKKTMDNDTMPTGFVFQSGTGKITAQPVGGFSFGFKPATSGVDTIDIAGSTAKATTTPLGGTNDSGFKFGANTAAATTSATTNLGGFKFGADTAAITTSAKTNLGGFKFSSDTTAITSKSTTPGFAFGLATTAAATIAPTVTATVAPSSNTPFNITSAFDAAKKSSTDTLTLTGGTTVESSTSDDASKLASGLTYDTSAKNNSCVGKSFGNTIVTSTASQDNQESTTTSASGFVFKPPPPTTTTVANSVTPLTFGVSTGVNVPVVTSTTTTTIFNPLTTGTSTATAIKPIFSFGSSPSTTSTMVAGSADTVSTTATSTQSSKALSGGFKFGTATTSTRPIFSNAETVPTGGNDKKIFRSFGSAAPVGESSSSVFGSAESGTTTALTLFGSATSTSPNSTVAITTAPTTTSVSVLQNNNNNTNNKNNDNNAITTSGISSFGNFGATPSANQPSVFGSPATASNPTGAGQGNLFGGSTTQTASQPPVFGSPTSSNPNGTGQSSFFGTNSNTPSIGSQTSMFRSNTSSNPSGAAQPNVFGNSNATPSAFVFGAAAAVPSTTAAETNNWSQNTFVFGGNAAQSINAPVATKSVFGSFGGSVTTSAPLGQQQPSSMAGGPSNQTPSMFGGVASVSSPTFGAGAQQQPQLQLPPNSGLFGTNSTIVSQPVNMFAPVQNNANTGNNNQQKSVFGGPAATPAFASTNIPTFGASASGFGMPQSQTSVSAFGTISSPNTGGGSSFSGFGTSGTTHPSSSTTDGASAPKKSDGAFNFTAGGSQGGFNFGANASSVKPAFNFSASSNTPTFNFSGIATEQMNQIPIVKPFQFGATPAVPVFNFSGGAVEATANNAPFQFSAGVPSASTNIFAPSPTPGSTQTAQQARRKIRAPVRRTQPR